MSVAIRKLRACAKARRSQHLAKACGAAQEHAARRAVNHSIGLLRLGCKTHGSEMAAVCILVVEDEPIILMSAAAALEDVGHEVMIAGHGPHAIGLIKQWPARFTCLITDFHMPFGMTGAHVIAHMRQSYPTIPMIITTALVHVVPEEWRRQYCVEMLAKPHELEALVATVGRLLQPG